MSDEAKAIEEVARSAGKAIDASRDLGGFLGKYIGGPVEQLSGLLEDRLRYSRWERQVRLAERSSHASGGYQARHARSL